MRLPFLTVARRGLVASRLAVVAALIGAAALVSCAEDYQRSGKAPVDPRDLAPKATYPALQRTLGELAVLGTDRPWFVTGYGLVANLPRTGSGEMPPNVRQILTELLYHAGAGSPTQGTEDIRPERILESNEIAAVEVRGWIPPMATRGATFDLTVTALPGTSTTSLEHGLLWASELRVIGGLDEAGGASRVIAKGRGPIFCPPDLGTAATQPDKRSLRKARVIAGGELTEDMPVALQLYTPSGRFSLLIERLINARFPARPPYAKSEDRPVVSLRIPPEFRENPREFLEIISHLYLEQDSPGFVERKATELLAALRDPNAPHREISYALQGLGRTIITDQLRPQYTSDLPTVRFYAARAGANLLDVQAMVVLEEIALDSRSPYQREAISAIGEICRRSRDPYEVSRRSAALMQVLNHGDLPVRLAAYEALAVMGGPMVQRLSIARKFDIDLVPSTGPGLIYASQTGHARIALIGQRLEMIPGATYVTPDTLLTLVSKAAEEAAPAPAVTPAANADVPPPPPSRKDEVLLYYRGPLGNKPVQLTNSRNLAGIIRKLAYSPDPHEQDYNPREPFIGVSYQRVLEVLAALCDRQYVEATFVLQAAPLPLQTTRDILENARPEGRVVTAVPSTAPGTAPATAPAPRPTGTSGK